MSELFTVRPTSPTGAALGDALAAGADLPRRGEVLSAALNPEARDPDLHRMETFEATLVLPMAHVMAATAGLRGDLRRQILGEETLVLADWATFHVTPPVEEFDAEGGVVYRYRATVQCHSWSDFLHSVSTPA